MQFPFIKDLQENVKNRSVRFFNFVEQHHSIRPLPDLVHQHPTLLIADIARRSAIQQCRGMFFLEFRHVEPDHGRFIVKKKFSQCFCQFSFTRSCRA